MAGDVGSGSGLVLRVLGGAVGCGGSVGRTVQLSFQLLLLFPLCVSYLLIGRQHCINLAVGVLVDGAAGLVIGLLVGGGVGAEAVLSYVQAKKDHAELDDLVLVKVELFLEHGELAGSSLGRRNDLLPGGGGIARIGGRVGRLGMDGKTEAEQEGQQVEALFHCGQIYVNP
jgi:hypothetical protein